MRTAQVPIIYLQGEACAARRRRRVSIMNRTMPRLSSSRHRGRGAWLVEQLPALERQVDGAAGGRETFSPGTLEPQAVGLDHAHRRIGDRGAGQLQQAGVVDVAGVFDEDARRAGGRVEVGVRHQFLGQALEVAVQQREQAEAGQQDHGALRRFQQGDGADPLGAAHLRTARRPPAWPAAGPRTGRCGWWWQPAPPGRWPPRSGSGRA